MPQAFIARFDQNNDGVLDRGEFVDACASDSMLLQASAAAKNA